MHDNDIIDLFYHFDYREFLKDSDRKELGLWDNSDDASKNPAFAEPKQ